MKKPLISIIIPVYNSQDYIEQCLKSILNQTFTDFEVLLINDGSKDKSGSICDSYIIKDNRIKVYHKKNGGVSSARNLGLENATGEWITFVDSDDYIHLDFLKNFCESINKKNDFIFQKVVRFDDNKSNEIISYLDTEMDQINFLNNYSLYPNYSAPWSKLLNRKIISDNNIKFDPKIAFGEDALFNITYLKYCNSIKTINKVGYYYRDTPNGLSKINFNLENDKYLFHKIKSKLLEYVPENTDANKKILERQLIYVCGRVINSIYAGKKKNDLTKTSSLLKDFFIENEYIIYHLYRKSKGLGFILSCLLKSKQIFLADKLLKHIIFR